MEHKTPEEYLIEGHHGIKYKFSFYQDSIFKVPANILWFAHDKEGNLWGFVERPIFEKDGSWKHGGYSQKFANAQYIQKLDGTYWIDSCLLYPSELITFEIGFGGMDVASAVKPRNIKFQFMHTEMEAPAWAKYVACDLDGKVYAYNTKPEVSSMLDKWNWDGFDETKMESVYEFTYQYPQWKYSLHEIVSSENGDVTLLNLGDGSVAKHEPVAPHVKLEDSALDTQEGGSHYKDMQIQPIEFIHANKLDFLQGNVIKYVTRHKSKNGAEDIKKAIHYCKLILELDYNQ